jgi:hypothetical protein
MAYLPASQSDRDSGNFQFNSQMTLLDAHNLIFEFFKSHDVYSHKDNYKELLTIDATGSNEVKMAILDEALSKFQKMELVSLITVPHETDKTRTTNFWVLVKPLPQWEQIVSISGNVAQHIATMVNNFAKKWGDKDVQCNPLEVREKDIYYLLIVIDRMMGEADKSA